jgi:hypothetical protein
MGEPA